MPNLLNGLSIDRSCAKDGNTIFIPLPRALWTPCGPVPDKCPCRCPSCAEVPGRVAYWDTLALGAEPKKAKHVNDTTWAVHRPEDHPYRLLPFETDYGIQVAHNNPGVSFLLACESEDTPIEGNALASGDDEADRKAEQWIRDQLSNGNEWAWCTAHVTALYRGSRGEAYLGCCSHESEADFRVGGYFESLIDDAIAELNRQLAVLPPQR